MESWVGLFREWKVMADSLYGEVIGVGNDDRSMLEWLGAQGFQEDSGPGTMRYRSKSCDMLSVLERLSVKSAEGIDDQDRRDLHRIDSMFRYLGEGGKVRC